MIIKKKEELDLEKFLKLEKLWREWKKIKEKEEVYIKDK